MKSHYSDSKELKQKAEMVSSIMMFQGIEYLFLKLNDERENYTIMVYSCNSI